MNEPRSRGADASADEPALPPDLLSRPAAEAARLVALGQLRRAEEAAQRLASPEDDAEALHDFRVAVRRLRSLLRGHRSLLEGAPGRKTLDRLRRIARATNAGRDAEVQAGWVRRASSPRLAPTTRRAAAWLAAWLDDRRDEEYQDSVERSRRRFVRLARDLRPDLTSYRVTLDPSASARGVVPEAAYGMFIAQQLRDDLARLRRRLDSAAQELDAEEPAHRARLAAKRLRYTLEPLHHTVAEAEAVLEELKGLQDRLGELNDSHVLVAAMRRAVFAAAEERAGAAFAAALAEGARRASARRHPSAGLISLVDVVRDRRRAAAQSLQAWVRSDAAQSLWRDVEGFVAQIDDSVGGRA